MFYQIIISLAFQNILKYGFLFLLLLGGKHLPASNCDQEEWEAAYRHLYARVDAYEPVVALALADSLLKVMEAENADDCPLYQWVQYEKGEAFELLRQNENALTLYYQLAKEAEINENWEIAAHTYISIGRTHETINRPEDCHRNLRIAREIIETYDLNTVFSRFAVRYSSYHRLFDNRDSARVYALLAIEYGKKYGVQRSELDGHLLMGIVTDELDKSVFHFQSATDIYLQREAFYGASTQKRNIAKRFYEADKIKPAIRHLDTAFVYAAKVPSNSPGYHDLYQDLYEKKQQFFEKRGMLDSAYFYLKKSQKAERLANIQVNQEAITEKEMAFAIEREQEKLRYEQQRALYLRRTLTLAGILLAVVIGGLINNERKKRFIAGQKDLILEQNEELSKSLNHQSLLLSEVHHRVKNNLQLVMSLLTLQGRKNPEPEVQIQFDDLSNKVRSIALIHDQLYRTGEFEKIDLQAYFGEITSHFKALQNEENLFSIKLQMEQIRLNLETVLPLGIICTELISNSLKYARLPELQLKLQLSVNKAEDGYMLQYQDNGPGYPNGTLERKANSMGAMLIHSMIRQLRAESKTFNANGAVFSLNFKEKQVSSV